MNDFDQIIYRGCSIDKFEHPSLSGKYEVYSNEEKFIGRFCTIKECKTAVIDFIIEKALEDNNNLYTNYSVKNKEGKFTNVIDIKGAKNAIKQILKL